MKSDYLDLSFFRTTVKPRQLQSPTNPQRPPLNFTKFSPIMAPDPFLRLKPLLNASEIIEPSSPSYRAESLAWAAQKNLHPKLVIRPTTVSSLSKILAYLSRIPLDFAVRSQGFGSSSAKDVLISMTAFNEFEFDPDNEVVTIGAGQSWGGNYKKMEAMAPEYAGRYTHPNRCEIDC